MGLDPETFFNMKSDSESNIVPQEEDLDKCMDSVDPCIGDIVRISDAGYGSFIEIAHEWTWVNAMDVLEILNIRSELDRRVRIIQRAQSL